MKCKNCGHGLLKRIIGMLNEKEKYVHYKSVYLGSFINKCKCGCTNPEPPLDDEAKAVKEFNDRWSPNPEPRTNAVTGDNQPNETRLYDAVAANQKRMQ